MDDMFPGLDLCEFPAGTPPDGTQINFENPPTLVPVLISICVIMTISTVFFTTCRLYVNRQKLWWSDYFVIVALIASLVNTGIMLAQTRFARHQWDVRACWYDGTYTKLLFSGEIMISLVLFFSKSSIFLLFHQIFEIQRPMRIAIRVGIISSALLYITNIPLSATLSAPRVGETWASVLISGRPQKELIWGVVQSACGIVLDLFIFILPIPVILRLQLSTKKKIQLLAVFTTALVGVIASILSLVYRAEAIGTNDGTWKYTSLLICTVVENGVAIIVSCTPAFAKFTRTHISELWIVKLLRSSISGSKGGESGISDKPSWNHKEDPNRPRTGRAFGKKANNISDEVGDTFILKSVVSTQGSVTAAGTSGILRTVDVSQETHYPGPGHTNETNEPQIQNYPTGFFYYGPGAVQPPVQSIWFYYVPTSTQQQDGLSFVPYYRSDSNVSDEHVSQNSTDGYVVHRHEEV